MPTGEGFLDLDSRQISGVLRSAHGGTESEQITSGDLLHGIAAQRWDTLAIGSSGEVLRVGSSGLPEWGVVGSGSGSVLLPAIANNAVSTWDETDEWLIIQNTQNTLDPGLNWIEHKLSTGTVAWSVDWSGGMVTENIAATGTIQGTTITATTGFSGDGASITNLDTDALDATITVAQGGTGKSSWTAWRLPYLDGSSVFQELTFGTSGWVLMSNGATSAPSFQAFTAVITNPSAEQVIVAGDTTSINYSLTLDSVDATAVADPDSPSLRLRGASWDGIGSNDHLWDILVNVTGDDVHSFLVRDNGVTQLSIDQAGLVTVTNNLTVSGNVAGDLTLAADLIIGTDPGDSGRLRVGGTGKFAAASAGAVAPNGNTVLLIERNSHAYFQALVPEASDGGFFVGDPSAGSAIRAGFNFPGSGADSIQFRTGGNTTRWTMDSSGHLSSQSAQNIDLGGDLTLSGSTGTIFGSSTNNKLDLNTSGHVTMYSRGGMIFRIDSDNNATGHTFIFEHNTGTDLFRIGDDGDVWVGSDVGDSAKFGVDGRVKIQNATAGLFSPNANARLVIEANADAYIHFGTPDANASGILFGDVAADIKAGILANNSDGLEFRTGGNTTRLTLDSSGDLNLVGTMQCDSLRIDQTATSCSDWENQIDRYFTINLNGTTHYVPAKATAPLC